MSLEYFQNIFIKKNVLKVTTDCHAGVFLKQGDMSSINYRQEKET